MGLIPEARVQAAILETRQELSPYLQHLDLEQLSKHNKGYLAYADDPVRCFIDTEIHTHTKIVDLSSKSLSAGAQVVDIGFFIPVIPIALAKLGFHVSSVEKLAFYDHALDDIISFATQTYDIELLDLDILRDDLSFLSGKFDCVILSAIFEHLNGSPRYLLERIKILGKKGSRFMFAVPNVATIRKRLTFLLKGRPPFPPISDYYHSAYPFTGHNREYTVGDLLYVLEQSDFEVVHIEGYNRHNTNKASFKDRLWGFLAQLGSQNLRESLLAVGHQR